MLVELSYLFRQLCAKELSRTVIDELDEELVRQTDEEERPHKDDEGEAAGTGSASSPTPSDSP